MQRSGNRTVVVLAALFGVLMVGSGLTKLAGESHQVTSFAMWGLPPWFRALVGTFEIVGAILLAVPATTPAGSLILSTIVVGALWTHAAHAEWTHMVPAGVLLPLFLGIFWRTRSRAVELLGGATAVRAPRLTRSEQVQATAEGDTTMTRFSRGVIWFDRFVLAAATFVMMAIAIRNLRDPVAATMPVGILLASPTAVTIARVGLGGFPLGFALVLFSCLISPARLITGLTILAAVIGAATAARIQGLVVDGATAYNLALLRPELAMLTLSAVGIALGRFRGQRHTLDRPAAQPSTSR